MARINIEECWWSDPRRTKLMLKIGFAADSAAVNMWRSAMEFWRDKKREPVPRHIFDKLEYSAELIECGLAEVRDDFIYVRGSSERLEWINQKKDSGREGGKKSAQRPRDAKGRLLKRSEKSPSKVQADSKQTPSNIQAKSKHIQPSSSSSGSCSIQTPSGSGELLPAIGAGLTPVGLWIAAYERKYGVRYELLKQDTGMLTNFANGRKAEEVARLFACYLAIDSKFYRDQKHALKFFFSDLQKISYAAKTGENPATAEKSGLEAWVDETGVAYDAS